MDNPLKAAPAYAIASVDHALRLATILQVEGDLTVAEAAARLGVARSTAHRLLQMLVYRDFASQAADRSYRAGPVLELASHSRSDVAALREAALAPLQRLVNVVQESANLAVRVGATTRFIASVESRQALRVGTREGMVFPVHRTTAGLLLLAELAPDEVAAIYESDRSATAEPPDLTHLRRNLSLIRRQAFAVNRDGSERGVTAVGIPVRDRDGTAIAGLSISLPSVRYSAERLPALTTLLRTAADAIEAELATTDS